MANDPQKSTEACNAEANATGHLLDGGFLRYYEGTLPATANASLGAAVLLAELGFAGTAFQDAVNGAATANPISPCLSAVGSGSAGFYRAVKSDGVSPILQGTIGLSGCDINIDDTNILIGVQVTCDSFIYAVPRGA